MQPPHRTTRREILARSGLAALSASLAPNLALARDRRPNVVMILADDLGFGDLGVTGNKDVPTPNLDGLARQGTRFSQFYVASPICSPSRVGILTGQFPARHLIHTYLNDRKSNHAAGMRDWLDPAAPSIAQAFRKGGYSTAHFGKWHLGGGRDVGDAPLPQAYGFDESVTSFEGLGDRILGIEDGGLSKQSAALGNGRIEWRHKYEQTERYVDYAIDFVRRNRERPFFLQLWPCDVHDAHHPREDRLEQYKKFSANPYVQRFYAVLDEFDRQMGRLFRALDETKTAGDTIVLFTGDNGPTAWPRYYREGFEPPGSTGGFRGRKWSLYEGGIRQPLLVRWTGGRIPAGRVDETTVVSSVDLFPTLCSLAGLAPPRGAESDGLDLSAAFRGRTVRERKKPLLWEYGRGGPAYPMPGKPEDQSPQLAIRDGHWKLLVNRDGTGQELYDFRVSQTERSNVAGQHPEVAERLKKHVLGWRESLPVLEDKQP